MCRLSRVGWIGSFGRARSPPIEEAETGLHVYCTKINPSSPCLRSMHMHRSCVDHAWIIRCCCRSVKLVTAASGFERATDAPLRIHFGLSMLNAQDYRVHQPATARSYWPLSVVTLLDPGRSVRRRRPSQTHRRIQLPRIRTDCPRLCPVCVCVRV